MRINLFRVAAFGASIALAMAGIVNGQQDDLLHANLSCRAEKASTVLGEPVSVVVTLSNPTAAPLTFHRDLNPEAGHLYVEVTLGGGIARAISGADWGTDDVDSEPAVFAPKESSEVAVNLLFNSTEDASSDRGFMVFPQAGV